jgi:hypothetical protein
VLPLQLHEQPLPLLPGEQTAKAALEESMAMPKPNANTSIFFILIRPLFDVITHHFL